MTHVLLFRTLDMYHPSTWQCFLHVKKQLQNQMSTSKLPPQIRSLFSVPISLQSYHQLSIVQKSRCDLSTCFFFPLQPLHMLSYRQALRIFTSYISLKSLSFSISSIHHYHGPTTIMPHLGFITKLQIFIAMWSPSNCISQSFLSFLSTPSNNSYTVI